MQTNCRWKPCVTFDSIRLYRWRFLSFHCFLRYVNSVDIAISIDCFSVSSNNAPNSSIKMYNFTCLLFFSIVISSSLVSNDVCLHRYHCYILATQKTLSKAHENCWQINIETHANINKSVANCQYRLMSFLLFLFNFKM